jgi:hypothetical protein
MSWELAADNRWERKRKLLPQLRLKYPNDLEMERLANLAEVNDPLAFAQHISIVLDAHLNDAALRKLSIPKVREALNKVTKRAKALAEALHCMDVHAKGSANRAGVLLEYQMGDSPLEDRLVLIPDCVQLLNWLNDSAFKAAKHAKSPRGPKGAGGNRAFNLFVQSLIMAAWQHGGDWTNSRSAEGIWEGSLLKALEILKPYLPGRFFPDGELGRSIEHIRKKFKDSTKI